MSRDYSRYINRPGYEVPSGYDPSKFPRQAVTTDIVLLCFSGHKIQVLLILRKKMPFENYWALPGGFVEMDEDLMDSAKRELVEETGLKDIRLFEFGAFGHPRRDPRGRTVTIAYLALVRKDKLKPKAGDDAKDFNWFWVRNLPELAFDHELVLKQALLKLKEMMLLNPLVFELLPKNFSGLELSELLREIFRRRYDENWLIKKMLGAGLIQKTGEKKFKFRREKFFPGALWFLYSWSADVVKKY